MNRLARHSIVWRLPGDLPGPAAAVGRRRRVRLESLGVDEADLLPRAAVRVHDRRVNVLDGRVERLRVRSLCILVIPHYIFTRRRGVSNSRRSSLTPTLPLIACSRIDVLPHFLAPHTTTCHETNVNHETNENPRLVECIGGCALEQF